MIMKLPPAALAPLTMLKEAFKYAFIPFLKDVFSKFTAFQWGLISFTELKRIFFFHLWSAFGRGSDPGIQHLKRELLGPAQGIVLDLGAGLGNSIRYLQRDNVSRYIAVEPNLHMHSGLRDVAQKAGYFESDGSFVLLSCGAGDLKKILESSCDAGATQEGSIDTIISVLSLCSIPHAEEIITRLVREGLRPGGSLLMFEHVRHPHADVAWWQWLWSPLWSVFFDGCRLDCPTDRWIEEMKDVDESGKEIEMWMQKDMKGDNDSEGWEESFLYHIHGALIKHD